MFLDDFLILGWGYGDMVVRQGGGVMEEGLYGGWKGGGRLRQGWMVAAMDGGGCGKVGIRVMEATA